MIFVDSSVWINFFRGQRKQRVAHLVDLLDRDLVALTVPVYLELLSGASVLDFKRLKRLLSALPVYYPTEHTWPSLEGWIQAAGQSGERFGFGDLLIAAIAAEAGGKVWSFDRDFERMEKLGFLKCHYP